jgi:hypothetical protein
LHILDATVIDGNALFNAKPGSVILHQLEAHRTLRFKLPYDLEDNHKDICVRIDAISSNPKLEYTSIQRVTVELPLDVNVHDLFKSSHVLSRFHVRSSNEMPLEILHITLEETNAFAVEPPPAFRLPVMIFAKQPATFMYKLLRKKNKDGYLPARQPASQEPPLTLTVDYQCVDEIAKKVVLGKLISDLKQSKLTFLMRLLVKSATERLETVFTAQAYGEFAMTGEIIVPNFEDFGWISITSQLEKPLAESINAWLGDWHQKNRICYFNTGSTGKHLEELTDSLAKRTILISVPLPRLHVLQTARLSPNIPSTNIVSVGIPIPAILALKHTRCWESPFTDTEETENPSLDFTFDVDAPQDTWLIGGSRRGRFRSKEGELSTWKIILVPLRTGQLSLPNVEIRLAGKNMEDMSCEIEYEGLGRRITVVGNLQSTSLIMKDSDAILLSGQMLS